MSLLPKFLGTRCWNMNDVVFPYCDQFVEIVIMIKGNHVV